MRQAHEALRAADGRLTCSPGDREPGLLDRTQTDNREHMRLERLARSGRRWQSGRRTLRPSQRFLCRSA